MGLDILFLFLLQGRVGFCHPARKEIFTNFHNFPVMLLWKLGSANSDKIPDKNSDILLWINVWSAISDIYSEKSSENISVIRWSLNLYLKWHPKLNFGDNFRHEFGDGDEYISKIISKLLSELALSSLFPHQQKLIGEAISTTICSVFFLEGGFWTKDKQNSK